LLTVANEDKFSFVNRLRSLISFECDKYLTIKYPARTHIVLEDILEQV
jgi:hypothetical protein